MTQLIPVALFEHGFTELVSVIPPNAALSPGSKIQANQRGKVPGRKNRNGTWGGFNWRTYPTAEADVRRWALDGANIGIRAARFPGLDIDSLDAGISTQVEQLALATLGAAPVRIGRPPKRLLMYRTAEPFARMRLVLRKGDVSHLIELLGDGQQYLLHGIHPGTMRPYSWSRDIATMTADDLTWITQKQVDAFFDQLREVFQAQGYTVVREGDGRRHERALPSTQAALHAPSIDALREAVAFIPNTDELFPTRDDYIRVGYAIRAACGDELEEGLAIFTAWAQSHASDGRVAGNPDTPRNDWHKMSPPFSVGWPYLAELARAHGYNDAANDFPTEGVAPASPPPQRVKYSDRWLADEVLDRLGDRLRYVPGTGRWLVWNGARWELDELKLAMHEISLTLHTIANEVLARDSKAGRKAMQIESAGTLSSVMKLVEAHPAIAVPPSALDADPWVINTPSGLLDLRTGKLGPALPEQLCTKSTLVGPDFEAECPEWIRFLNEAAGSPEQAAYLERYAGYSLTGDTSEQVLSFVFGPSGRGKTTYTRVLLEILHDYGKVAAIDTFTSSKYERHSTDLAALMGARLVLASEPDEARVWDETRIKTLTGGEKVTARFMRQDNFTYRPQFKLLFTGNHKPRIRDLDGAMRRRIQLSPFVTPPAQIDGELEHKLRSEYPAIFARFVRACLAWQQQGLNPPPSVIGATEEYFEEEDGFGRWIKECCTQEKDVATDVRALFESWREWANEANEFVGSQKRLARALVERGFDRRLDPESRRSQIIGLQVKAESKFP